MTGSTGGSPHRGRPNDTVRGLIGGEVVADWVEGTSSIFRAALPITALYLTGSICLGAFNPALSDLDLSVITNQTVDEVGLGEVAGLLEGHGPPPAHGGLDVELFDAADARDPSMPLRWHGTIRWRRDVARPEVHAASPYGALDWAPSLELTRRHGIAILGAGPRDLIGAVPEELLLGACRDELAEWASYEAHWSLPGGVLAACRAWWFWEEGGLGSKIAAAAWALVRADPADAVLIERALDLYWQAVPHDITAREVITFVGNVERKISPSRPDPGGPGL